MKSSMMLTILCAVICMAEFEEPRRLLTEGRIGRRRLLTDMECFVAMRGSVLKQRGWGTLANANWGLDTTGTKCIGYVDMHGLRKMRSVDPYTCEIEIDGYRGQGNHDNWREINQWNGGSGSYFFEPLRCTENPCTPDACHADATCTNNDGNVQCACNAGFIGNGHNCEAVM